MNETKYSGEMILCTVTFITYLVEFSLRFPSIGKMMNYTILALFAADFMNPSPMFASHESLSIYSSQFSDIYASIIYSHKMTHSYLSKVKFSRIFNTAIYLDSDLNLKDRTYSQTYIQKENVNSITIDHCLFLRCKSQEEGGAMKIVNENSNVDLTILNSGFSDCYSKKGDAFYCITKKLYCKNCCIDKCGNSAFYSHSNGVFFLEYVLLSNSKLNSTIESVHSAKDIIKSSNITNNQNGISISVDFSQISLSFCFFSQNSGEFFFSFSHKVYKVFDYHFESDVFLENKFSGRLIESTKTGSTVHFKDSAFIHDDINMYTSLKTTISDCTFSLANEREVRNKFSAVTIYSGNKFGQENYTTQNYGITQQCWDLIPTEKSQFQFDFSKNLIISGGATFLLAVCLVFVICSCCRTKRYSDQIPLMYTR
ncbi:hypothetical protein TRFO_34187 [Tritrichomonas foetus]|uniref:Uncharacterized protein n=1 Tax=Tritrichomonas foetus TaxID=1144522 RepID=A0A1J4JLT7_9EUKA|nr:hypothetical protein TRFO_34187 [Tritrichomonas foetus]|eukprot:OHS99375.1 hypothetical protein TRFO_34187 [Tritrichomonas foetus]